MNTENFGLINPELTLEQKFQIQLMEKSAQTMSRDEALDLLLQASRLLMLKDNVIKQLMGEAIA
ncbi:MAG: NblA/ycf18 family protein [Spirulinaceae cyanobacterium]